MPIFAPENKTVAAVTAMARVMYGEARGQGTAGMIAVGHVIANRALHPRWWGKDIISVCLAKAQFSCMLQSDPNYLKLMAVTREDYYFDKAIDAASDIVNGLEFDVTNGADSYANLTTSHPAWAEGRQACAIIGQHTFFKLEL